MSSREGIDLITNDKVKSSLFEDDVDVTSAEVKISRKNRVVFDVLPAPPATAPTTKAEESPSMGADRRASVSSSRYSAPARSKIVSDNDNPLSQKMLNSYDSGTMRVTKENLTIRREDEVRIVASIHNAAKKQATGAIYSVVVDLGKTGTLGIGVKDLADSVLAVSMLKRENCCPGAGEDAGLELFLLIKYTSNFTTLISCRN